MKLVYPISSELFTFVHLLNRTVEISLRRECGLSVVQYRTLSCLKQAKELEEARIAQILDVGASQLSQAIGPMVRKKYVRSQTRRGPNKFISLASAGKSVLADADLALIDACNEVFDPLGAELGSAIRAGSMLTNQRHGIVRVDDGAFFEEHACFEAFLEAERITKRAERDYELTHTQLRIMFELLCRGPLSKSELAKTLILAPSVISEACSKLEKRGVIAATNASRDKRVRAVALTEAGRRLTEEAAEHVDRRCYEDIRPSSDDERNLYQRMADIVVHR